MSMKAKIGIDRLTGRVGGARSESGGCAEQPVGGAPLEIPDVVRDRLADEVIDELLAGAWTEEEIVGPGGVLAQLTKRLVEQAMSGELTEHLGDEPRQERPGGVGNTRYGSTAKTLATEHGLVEIRDAQGRQRDLRAADRQKGSAPRHRRRDGRRAGNGSNARSMTSTRWSFSTRWCSKIGRAARCSAGPATSRSA